MKRVMLMLAGVMLITVWTGVAFADDRFVLSEKTVKDMSSGLVWTRDANLGERDWKGAFELVKELNRKEYAGFEDWRLPSKEELLTLVTFDPGLGSYISKSPKRFLKRRGFYGVDAFSYWSSTTYADKAWSIIMEDGWVDYYPKAGYGFVWPVRGGQ